MIRLAALARLLVLVVIEVGALMLLVGTGDVERWSVPWGDVWAWMDRTPAADVAVALGRQVAVVICGWLLVTTALYLVAVVTRVPFLMATTGRLTIPAVRRVVGNAAMWGGLASMLLARPAGAHEMPVGGWVTDAVVQPDQGGAVAPTPEQVGAWSVAPGDNLWTIAETTVAHYLGIDRTLVRCAQTAAYWERLVADNTGLRSGDPNLIYPGEVVSLPGMGPRPGTVAPVPVLEPTPEPTPGPTEPTPEPTPAPPPAVTAPAVTAPVDTPPGAGSRAESTTTTDAPVDTPPEDDGAELVSRVDGARVVGMGVLCAGLVALVWSRKHRRRRTMAPGETEPVPDQEAAEMDRRLHAGATPTDAIVDALRTLAAVAPDVAPLGVVSGDVPEIVLAEEAHPVPRGFRGRGRRVSLDSPAIGDGLFPCPAAISFGRSEGGSEVVVDVEQAGMVAVSGPGSVEMVRAIGLSLSAAPWPDTPDVVLVGFSDAPDLSHVQDAGSLESVIADLEDRASAVAVAVSDAGVDSTYEARARGVAADAWTPTVVVCLSPQPEPVMRRLVEITTSPDAAGVAAVVVGEVAGAPWSLPIRNGTVALPGFAEAVSAPVAMSQPSLSAVRRLLESAEAPPVPAARSVSPEPRGEVLVRLLGTPEVEGVRWERAKSLEALAYLVVHRDSLVDTDTLADALYPGVPVASARRSLHQAMRGLRNTLGDGPDGLPLVPKLAGGGGPGLKHYQVSTHVSADVERLRWAVSRSSTSAPDEAVEMLGEAVALIRGEPYATSSEWSWARTGPEGEARSLALEAAARLARLHRDRGEMDAARAAVRAGLRACPGCEPLYALEMELSADDPVTVDALYRELAATTPDELSAETIALHRELTRA